MTKVNVICLILVLNIFRHLARSRSRSRQIMERARSFDRLAAETCHSNPGSRPPSRTRGRRSPSFGRQLNEQWQQGSFSRPESRGPDFEPPKRWQSVGRIDTAQWEGRIRDASPGVTFYSVLLHCFFEETLHNSRLNELKLFSNQNNANNNMNKIRFCINCVSLSS